MTNGGISGVQSQETVTNVENSGERSQKTVSGRISGVQTHETVTNGGISGVQ